MEQTLENIAAIKLRTASAAMMTAALELEAMSAWHEMALPKALEMQGAANIAIQWAEELEAIHVAKQTPNTCSR
jgi:hypothetical protein